MFIELSGYASSDLTPALQALEAALSLEDYGDPDTFAHYLVDYAVVAYCRAFFVSKVRGLLTDYVSVPVQFVQLHDDVRAFRNRTVAHSQSRLSTIWPVFLIDQSGPPFVRDVLGVDVSQTLPSTLVKSFIELIKALLVAIDDLLDPVRGRLLTAGRARLGPQSTLLHPGISLQVDGAFDPRSSRATYPLLQTLHLSRIDGADDGQSGVP